MKSFITEEGQANQVGSAELFQKDPAYLLKGKEVVHLDRSFTLSYNSVRFNGIYEGIERDNVAVAVWNDEKWLKINHPLLFERAIELLSAYAQKLTNT